MNNVVALQPQRAIRDYSPQQLALIRQTVASDCNEMEFNLYIEVARRIGLDPFRRQIYAVVYNKNDAERRKMSIITGIDGFRAVAARNRDYRPDDQEPAFEIDDTLKGPSNPKGLVKATVRAFKLAPDSQWFPVVGVAYWSEFAVMKKEGSDGFEWVESGKLWEDGPKKGKPRMKKVPLGDVTEQPDGKWAAMPHVMLAKAAEAQALRKGWPEDLSGVYAQEEMEREMLDITPTEAIEQHEQSVRLAKVNAVNAVPILWRAGEAIEYVPLGKMHDRSAEFIGKSESVVELERWRDVNQGGLREFWAMAKNDALAVKKILEERMSTLAKVE